MIQSKIRMSLVYHVHMDFDDGISINVRGEIKVKIDGMYKLGFYTVSIGDHTWLNHNLATNTYNIHRFDHGSLGYSYMIEVFLWRGGYVHIPLL